MSRTYDRLHQALHTAACIRDHDRAVAAIRRAYARGGLEWWDLVALEGLAFLRRHRVVEDEDARHWVGRAAA